MRGLKWWHFVSNWLRDTILEVSYIVHKFLQPVSFAQFKGTSGKEKNWKTLFRYPHIVAKQTTKQDIFFTGLHLGFLILEMERYQMECSLSTVNSSRNKNSFTFSQIHERLSVLCKSFQHPIILALVEPPSLPQFVEFQKKCVLLVGSNKPPFIITKWYQDDAH